MRAFGRNLRYGLRSLKKSPVFALAAVLTLGLGIGANTAVFSVVDAVILRPLPYRDAERLVMVWDQLLKLGLDRFAPTFANFYDYRAQNQAFEDIAAFSYSDMTLEGSGDSAPQRLDTMLISSNLLPVLGAAPMLGRPFTPDQNEPGRGDAVLLSDDLWRSRFGGDRGIIGKTVRLSGRPYRVQGVMPAGFQFTTQAAGAPDLWVPMEMPKSPTRQAGSVRLIARLKPGVTIEDANANLSAIASGIEAAYHPYNGPHGEQAGYHVLAVPLRSQLLGNFRSPALILAGAVALVLLIACLNVTNLLLARGERRQRDYAIRAALGATRRQLLAESAAESLVLVVSGACTGVLLASWAIAALPALSTLPEQTRLSLDWRVLGFTLAISLLTGLLFGLAPANFSARVELRLKEGKGMLGGRSHKFRSSLVTAEVALGVTLLAGAGLLLESFARLHRVDAGIDARNVLTMRLALAGTRYRETGSRLDYGRRLIEDLGRIPGVTAAALTSQLPLAGGGEGGDPFSIEGRAYDSTGRTPQVARLYSISPDYFRAMRVPLRSGRAITMDDSAEAPKVAVVNETLARGFWPQGDAIGHRILLGAPRPGAQWLTIVGIAGDVRNSDLRLTPLPQIYVPYTQNAANSFFVVLRTAGDPMNVALAAQRAAGSVDPGQAPYEVRTMEQRLEASIGRDRFQTTLLGIFAVAALALAAIGTYGVLEHSVSGRISEIGLRMAMGAQPGDVLRWVVVLGMSPAIVGLAFGLGGAFALTRFLRSAMFEISPQDPLVFAGAALVFLFAALAACLLPARRAMRVEPLAALRWE